MLLVKHEILTFDIENIKPTSVNFVNFHALTSDNNLTFDGYIYARSKTARSEM